jgi:hypothetical protein
MQASVDIAAVVQAASIARYLQICKHSTTFIDVLHIKDVLHINQRKFIAKFFFPSLLNPYVPAPSFPPFHVLSPLSFPQTFSFFPKKKNMLGTLFVSQYQPSVWEARKFLCFSL